MTNSLNTPNTPSDVMTTRMEFLADAMPQLVWVASPEGGCTYCNQQWYDYTGAERAQTLGYEWMRLFHPEDRERSMREWKRANSEKTTFEIEYRLYNQRTEAYRWVIGRAQPYLDTTGDIICWYGTCTDIDVQRRDAQRKTFLSEASWQLSSSLDYKKALKRVAKECVPIIADWCMVDLYNATTKQFEQISSVYTESVMPEIASQYRTINPIIDGKSNNTAESINKGEVTLFETVDESVIESLFSSPSRRQYMTTLGICSGIIVPIKAAEVVVGVMTLLSLSTDRRYSRLDQTMAEDLADRIAVTMALANSFDQAQDEIKLRRKLENDLRRQADSLEELIVERTQELRAQTISLERSNQELQDFAYVASHDLQEPLRKIQAFGDILQTEYANELDEGSQYLDRMRKAAARMSILIEDLLTFSRVSTRDPDNKPIDLTDVVKDVIDDLETSIDRTAGQVLVDDLPKVMSDSTHMRQLFQNLIGNALKFHKPDVPPVVRVTNQVDAEFAVISVADNGIGFDEKYIDKIFSVFQRLHGRAQYEGTGIGLAVCRKIVERYGGTITATSRPDSGSSFIIKLPLAKNEFTERLSP